MPSTLAQSAGRIRSSSTHAIEYIPLLQAAAAPLGTVADDSGTVRAERAAPLSRRNDGSKGRTAGPAKSEPGEIRITIGRIEVDAVPERRAQPAVKPARRHLTLDDYLKQADARRR